LVRPQLRKDRIHTKLPIRIRPYRAILACTQNQTNTLKIDHDLSALDYDRIKVVVFEHNVDAM
jgi:hypothetical protein